MKKLLLCIVAVGMVGCSSTKLSDINEKQRSFETYKEAAFQYPEWYLNPPSEEAAIFAAASEVSTDLQFAIDKGAMAAQREIAFKLNNDINQKFKEYAAESNYSKNENLTKETERLTIANSTANLVGVQRVKVSVIREGNRYRSFVLVRYGLDESNKIHANYMAKQRRANAKQELDKYDQELKGRTASPSPSASISDDSLKRRVEEVKARADAVIINETIR